MHNVTLLEQCVEWFGAAYVGVTCPEPAENQFNPTAPASGTSLGRAPTTEIEGGVTGIVLGWPTSEHLLTRRHLGAIRRRHLPGGGRSDAGRGMGKRSRARVRDTPTAMRGGISPGEPRNGDLNNA